MGNTYIPMCPYCFVFMIERDGAWWCPYALAAKAAAERDAT